MLFCYDGRLLNFSFRFTIAVLLKFFQPSPDLGFVEFHIIGIGFLANEFYLFFGLRISFF